MLSGGRVIFEILIGIWEEVIFDVIFIGGEIIKFYRNFCFERFFRFMVEGLDRNFMSVVDAVWLDRRFELEEIREIVFVM